MVFFEYRGILSTILANPAIRLDTINIYGAIFIFSISMFALCTYTCTCIIWLSSTVCELVSLQKISPIKNFSKYIFLLLTQLYLWNYTLAVMETLSDYGTVLYFGVDTFSYGIFKYWFGYGDLRVL